MSPEHQPTPREVLSAFIAAAARGERGEDPGLEAILLEHLLLQAGYKIVPREPDERALLAGILATEPVEIWRQLWDAAGIGETGDAGYTPA